MGKGLEKKIILTRDELFDIIAVCIDCGVSTGIHYPKNDNGGLPNHAQTHAEEEAIKRMYPEIQTFLNSGEE